MKRVDNKFYLSNIISHNCNQNNPTPRVSFINNAISNEYNGILNYNTIDGINRVKSLKGVNVKYSTMYKTLRTIDNNKNLFELSTYGLILPYLNWHTENNQGTVTDYLEQENTFDYAFIAPSTSKKIFSKILPLIGIDACHTTGTYKGVIMCATGIDGAGQIFPLALAVGPTENSKYWNLFLKSLQIALNLKFVSNLVIISDRDKDGQVHL
ncbi:hypothetical protein AYI69_g3364 [Smittium culicis]|uniref:MULE transposase domain-containing protein n=1 Tax=Smittium culicis TaxID=133412 RepID=A0A1R1YJX9_9FUNG|nr:hypothetical protein AYI69_g3364 [Smittium culicis]